MVNLKFLFNLTFTLIFQDINQPTFANVTVHVRPGELLAIIGSVGSGKSSVLMSILGELPLESGRISVRGKVAYAPQEAWAFVATVRENILFGAPFEAEKYAEVIRVCALARDLAQFPFGDRTIIGERGVTLSGGQKTRITLARALYRDQASIYLLDDPLSAVDSATTRHLFNRCILEHLREKAVVLVTHQLQFLQAADRILILKDGQAIACGSYSALKEQGIDFSSFVTEKKKTVTTSTEEKATGDKSKTGAEASNKNPAICPKEVERQKVRTFSWSPSIASTESEVSMAAVDGLVGHTDGQMLSLSTTRKELHYDTTAAEREEHKKEAPQVVVEEGRQSGSIRGDVYWQYVRASRSPLLTIVAVISMVASQCFFQASDIWITEW